MPSISVHRNLHKACWSLSRQGYKVQHWDAMLIRGSVRFVVQPAGNARVRREKRKHVHAFVRFTNGEAKVTEWWGTTGALLDAGYTRLTYNPYKHTTFVRADTEKPVHTAERVVLTHDGRLYAKKLDLTSEDKT
jgi:hypothetical protein